MNPEHEYLPPVPVPETGILEINRLYTSPPVQGREPTAKRPRLNARPGQRGVFPVSKLTFYRLVKLGVIDQPFPIGKKKYLTADQVRASKHRLSQGVPIVHKTKSAEPAAA